MSSSPLFDTLIKGAKIFNNGEPAIIEDIAIAAGKIVARGKDLAADNASRVIDGKGKWLMPGFLTSTPTTTWSWNFHQAYPNHFGTAQLAWSLRTAV